MLSKKNYKLRKAKAYIDSLDDSENSNLIRYYISNKDNIIANYLKKNKEFRDWFKTLSKFIPGTKVLR